MRALLLIAAMLLLIGCAGAPWIEETSCDELMHVELRALLSQPIEDLDKFADHVAAQGHAPRSEIATYEGISGFSGFGQGEPSGLFWQERGRRVLLLIDGDTPVSLYVWASSQRSSMRRWLECAGAPDLYGAHLDHTHGNPWGLVLELFYPEEGMVAFRWADSYLEPVAGEEWHRLNDNLPNYPLTGFVYTMPGAAADLVRAQGTPFILMDQEERWVNERVATLRPWPGDGASFEYNTVAGWNPLRDPFPFYLIPPASGTRMR